MDKYTSFILLCEDRQHEVFMRKFLNQCGVNSDRIRVINHKPGVGSGEQFVRKQYPMEVSAYRKKRNNLNIGLAVMIDADIKSIQDRYNELGNELKKARLPKRTKKEKIGIFIPKRSIETWIYFLMGQTVNEVDRYPKLNNESDCKSLVQQLANNRHHPLPVETPHSFQQACAEINRLIG